MISNIFSSLITSFPTWAALSAYLTSVEGGNLRVTVTQDTSYALIRYVKGSSNLTLPHVRAFRSVIWDTTKNRPVSVTPFKSLDGEGMPSDTPFEGYVVERFIDGVMIGAFWDKYEKRWRIHTRSTLDAHCRYFSQTTTFSAMFWEALASLPAAANPLAAEPSSDAPNCYTFILQHPENRIVIPILSPKIVCVQVANVDSVGNVRFVDDATADLRVKDIHSWEGVVKRVIELNAAFGHAAQGLVIRGLASGNRWKIRTAEYNRVRTLRGNSARRDFHWLSLWQSGQLIDYLKVYPEEKFAANTIVSRWKQMSGDVFHIYNDVFKAHSLDKKEIPPKYRPFVYGLHTLYRESLRPAGKTVDWKTVVEFMNGRDTAQKLYAINWELRQAAAQLGVPTIPIEPPVTDATVVTDAVPSATVAAVTTVMDDAE